MKTNDSNSRRQFLGALALGATASTLSVLTNPIYADTPTFDSKKMSEAEDWFDNIKGKHRIVYDGSTPHAGFPVTWNWAFYLSHNGTGTLDDDITAMTVLRHKAIPLAFSTSLWEKYPIGEVFEINDNATGKPSLRNPYFEPQAGDFPLPQIQGIKAMIDRGAMFCVCDLATKVYSNAVATKMNLDPKAVYEEWVNAVLPGIQVVPSGVWALGLAQEHDCGYIYAGE